jgi:glycosyltransferase 2 family protein
MTEDRQDHRPMADDPAGALPSRPMTALNRAVPAAGADPGEPAAGEPAAGETATPWTSAADGDNLDREVTPDQLSLGRRLRQPRTIISVLVPLVVLVLLVRALPGFDLAALPGLIGRANPALFGAAFAVYYLGFPLRGLRWTILLRGTGYAIRPRDGTEIIFISWLVNCLVPAKLGDVYRAYLLKINSPVSLSRTFGTVFIERILDLFAIVVLGLGAGFVSFRTGLPTAVQVVFALGVAVVILLAVGLLTMRNFGRRILLRLPLPHRALELYDRFEQGVFGAVGLRHLPPLVVITGLIWATEAMRLFLVVEALGIPGVHLGISGSFFVALSGSLLTAVPLTPGGLGIVETGVVGLLTLIYRVSAPAAVAITVLDRSISVLSIIILGSIAYVLSPLRRGAGLRGAREIGRTSATSV